MPKNTKLKIPKKWITVVATENTLEFKVWDLFLFSEEGKFLLNNIYN